MIGSAPEFLKVDARYQDLIETARLTVRSVFTDPRIKIWRTLPDRENGILDVPIPDVGTLRLHVKRYAGSGSLTLPYQIEVRGYHALLLEEIPTAHLVAFGKLKDRRSFTIFANLENHKPADKLIEAGLPFEKLLVPTADLAARLHNHGLHHRDLYLCHFLAKVEDSNVDLKLIDTARVGRLKSIFTNKRWIVKNLAQFWYSTTKLHITAEQREHWLARYAEQRGAKPDVFRHAIDRKVFSITRHDHRLNAPTQPQHLHSDNVNIALVILNADPARGGAERYTVDLAAALTQRGHQVSLLSSSFGAPIESVRNIPLPATGATRLSRYLHFLDALDLHLETNPYDIVHAMLPVRRCDVYHPHAGLAIEAVNGGHLKHDDLFPRTLAKLANRFNPKRQRFAAIEQRLLEAAHPPLVLCLSDYVKASVQKYYPTLPPDRLAKLFNSTDLARFDPTANPGARESLRKKFGLNDDHTVALMIAQDFERKRLRQALQALAKVANPNLRLLVVGKQNPGPYQKLARSLGISDRVIFAGPTTDPYSFYRAADFFVLPTRHDPCSLVVLESLIMGVPVISTTSNGACEIMQDGIHGFVLPDPNDVQMLTSKYEILLNPETRARMSGFCLRLRPNLSNDSHLDRLLQLYGSQR